MAWSARGGGRVARGPRGGKAVAMTIQPVWSGDLLQIRVAVTKDDASKDFSAATAEAAAQRVGTPETVAAARAIISDTGGASFDVDVTFEAGTLAAGVWVLQVRLTLGGDVQTVADVPITVTDSIL